MGSQPLPEAVITEDQRSPKAGSLVCNCTFLALPAFPPKGLPGRCCSPSRAQACSELARRKGAVGVSSHAGLCGENITLSMAGRDRVCWKDPGTGWPWGVEERGWRGNQRAGLPAWGGRPLWVFPRGNGTIMALQSSIRVTSVKARIT